ncbi:MAG: RcnB family protein [Sphingomonas sp.]
MRFSLIAALAAATALIPAAASAQDHHDHGGWHGGQNGGQGQPRPGAWHGQNGQPGAWRGQNRQPATVQPRPGGWHSEPSRVPAAGDWHPRANRPQPATGSRPGEPNHGQPAAGGWHGRPDGGQAGVGDRHDRPGGRPDWQGRGNRGGAPVAVGQQGWQGRPDRGEHRPDANRFRGDNDRRNNAGWRDYQRSNADWRDHYRDANRFGQREAFNHDWRRDRRYDWRDYRQRNRSIYHLPRYYAPGDWGYGYRRFGVGFTLDSMLFGPSYWIGDPWAYRLPPAYGPYRWVRYYDDALLVDVRTGYVVDVVYDIFW